MLFKRENCLKCFATYKGSSDCFKLLVGYKLSKPFDDSNNDNVPNDIKFLQLKFMNVCNK